MMPSADGREQALPGCGRRRPCGTSALAEFTSQSSALTWGRSATHDGERQRSDHYPGLGPRAFLAPGPGIGLAVMQQDRSPAAHDGICRNYEVALATSIHPAIQPKVAHSQVLARTRKRVSPGS